MLPPVRIPAVRAQQIELAAEAEGMTVLVWRRKAYEAALLRAGIRDRKLRAKLLALTAE